MSTPQDAPKKNIFADILSAPAVDALEKYANLFTSINPNELASIDQGKAFIPYVDKLIAGQFAPPSPNLIAIPSGMQTVPANGIPLSELLADGFPTDKKIHLFLYFEGPKVESEGEYEGDDKCINVALAVRKYFGVTGIAGNPEGLLVDIKG